MYHKTRARAFAGTTDRVYSVPDELPLPEGGIQWACDLWAMFASDPPRIAVNYLREYAPELYETMLRRFGDKLDASVPSLEGLTEERDRVRAEDKGPTGPPRTTRGRVVKLPWIGGRPTGGVDVVEPVVSDEPKPVPIVQPDVLDQARESLVNRWLR